MTDDRPQKLDDTVPLNLKEPARSLRCAMMSMRGHAEFAYLESIYQVARDDFAFPGSMKSAAAVLAKMPDVRVESAPELGQYRVFGKSYWAR